MPLAVIGAGYPRTGTMSLKLALEQLGFGPCHHMTELFTHPQAWPLWEHIADGGTPDWEALFAGYRSTTDAPGCWFYRELAERYPDAKVILSERDAQSWLKSMSATIMGPAHRADLAVSPVGQLIRKLAGLMGWAPPSGEGPAGPPPAEQMMASFEAHNAEVRRVIPADRLLVFQASQGWAPLCAFLGVDVPDTPYPHVNSTEEFATVAVPP